MYRITAAFLTLAVILSSSPAAAQEPPSDESIAAAREIVLLLKVDSLMITTMETSVDGQRGVLPDVPAAFWDRLLERARADLPMLTDSVSVIYARHVSLPDLQALLAFYQSPTGARIVAALPTIQTMARDMGARWGERIGTEVANEMTSQQEPVQ